MIFDKKVYDKNNVVYFWKVNEKFGGMSNMSPNFPIEINGTRIRTSEALYQSCKFPNYPCIQKEIINEYSPIIAKRVTKKYNDKVREDWENINIKIMYWCIRMKLAQNFNRFSNLLISSGDSEIVEYSTKDDFWGAMPYGDKLIGMNILGKLLTALRNKLKIYNNSMKYVPTPNIQNFKFLDENIKEYGEKHLIW